MKRILPVFSEGRFEMLFLALLAATSTAASERDGKTMAVDDWHQMSIYGVAAASSGQPVYLQVHAGDLDGDGRPDDAVLKLVCADGTLRSAHYALSSPRDVASGQASGKRTHNPVKFIKEWGPATPQLRAMKTSYDVKKAEGARMTSDGWTPVTLSAAGLCPVAEADAVKAHKSRSNIQNN